MENLWWPKITALLLGLQQEFKNYCCFVCEWDSRARSLHYSRRDWLSRKSLEPGIINVENQPLVKTSKILLPSMHLKHGLMKNFVNAMNKEEVAFTYLWEKFPRLSEAKLKEGVFIGPQIRDLIKDEYFDTLLQGEEKAAWESFKFVVKAFLGNRRAQNYEELVNNLLQSYQKLGCNTSLKIHSPHLHLEFFPQRIVVQWVMNTENVSIKTFLQWSRDMKGNGTVPCLPTTAGLWQGMSLPWNTSERQNKNKITWYCLC